MTQEIKILLGIGSATLLILLGGVFFLSKTQPQSTQVAPKVDAKLLTRSDSYKIGTDSAKATIVEFGDYQCPACGIAYPITKEVLAAYDKKIKFVFRNFPLTQHQNAQIAAEAAEAAGAQGKYWEMHNKLYEGQSNWSDSTHPIDIFMDYAKFLKLDENKFKQDVLSNKYAGRIQQDQSDGNALGINATPTFFLNGTQMTGIPSFADFKSAIDPLVK